MEGILAVLIVSSLTCISADILKHHISERAAKTFMIDAEAKEKCTKINMLDEEYERYCERKTETCAVINENIRETKCKHHHCSSGMLCAFDNPCPIHKHSLQCITDECASHTCHNGGTCRIGWKNPHCVCPVGYDGDDCSKTPCHSFTCLNGGTCNNVGSKAVCTCRPGFIHDDCGYGISADISKHLISARSAKSFLQDSEANAKCPDTNYESYCEENKGKCYAVNEDLRENKCKNLCPGQVCVFTNPCPIHRLPLRCIPDACASHTCYNGGSCVLGYTQQYCICPPGYRGDDCSTTPCHDMTCLNGGTCNNVGSKPVCTCRPGYIHDDCGYEPCASYVCHNGGTCKLVGDQPACDCTPGYETDICKMDCRPGPVDIVFVIDRSFSQSDGLDHSIDFVRKFINKVPVGKNDFQFAVITYSTDATVVFDFNDYTTKSQIESALDGVRFQQGATFTRKGLYKAYQILSDSSSGVRMTVSPKYVILLTDGLSTDRLEAIKYAEMTNSNEYRIMTVGVGGQVDHSEILQLASSSSYVYSPETDDAFNRIMIETSDQDCTECSESSTTDLFILLDTSSVNQTQSQYHETVNALKTLVKQLKVKDTDVHVGLARFDETADPVFVLGETLDTDSMLSHIVTIRRSKGATESNVNIGLQFAQHEGFKGENGGRIASRRIVVLFSNGLWKDTHSTKQEIKTLAENSIKVFIVGTGRNANIENLFEVVTSAFNVIYVSNSETGDNVQSIISETKYVNCKDGLFN